MPVSAMPWGHCPTAVGTALCGSSLGPLVTVSLAPSTLPQQAIEKLVALLNTLDRWIDETPPVDQPSRFGNKAYRTWYAKLDEVRLPQTGVGAGLGWAGRGGAGLGRAAPRIRITGISAPAVFRNHHVGA